MRRAQCAFVWKNSCVTVGNVNTHGCDSAAARASYKIAFHFIAAH